MWLRRTSVGIGVLGLAAVTACGSHRPSEAPRDAGGSQAADGGPGDDGGLGESGSVPGDADVDSGSLPGDAPPRAIAAKLDILFMIDNSASMGDKQSLVAQSVPELLQRLINPNCVDVARHVVGQSQGGQCSRGQLEFTPVHDMHIGIVTSSLGGRGSDQCAADAKNPVNSALLGHGDDRGELVNRTPPDEQPQPDAAPSNFLAWFPGVPENQGQPKPPVAALSTAGAVVGDFTRMVLGVNEHGCGFEAQNEAWYRFLVQPDPFDKIAIATTGQKASLQGVDATLLQQRADFLRPDSLVVIVVITDENEEVADPLALGGQAWFFANSSFPGSPNTAAPEGTIECRTQDPNNLATTGPNDPKCTSCALLSTTDPSFAARCPAAPPSTVRGYLDPSDDQLNVRFFNQKQRFGTFVGYPLSRYLRGLTTFGVPDSTHEHDGAGAYIGDQDAHANCLNPLFATNLPRSATDELCALQRGPRSPELIYYAAIAGVPHQLLQVDPTNPDSPQKSRLTEADWLKITGRDPEHYDFTGADFHMIESLTPRTAGTLPAGVSNASSCPPSSSDVCDLVNGREWDTKKGDLQFACIFQLPQAKDCTLTQYSGACDCNSGSSSQNTPLCGMTGTTRTQMQLYGKAYPSLREMVIAHRMGLQGVVSSLCPIHTTPSGGDSPPDPLFGYRPAWTAIVDRLAGSLPGP